MNKPDLENYVRELRTELSTAIAEIRALRSEVRDLQNKQVDFEQWRLGVESVWKQMNIGG